MHALIMIILKIILKQIIYHFKSHFVIVYLLACTHTYTHFLLNYYRPSSESRIHKTQNSGNNFSRVLLHRISATRRKKFNNISQRHQIKQNPKCKIQYKCNNFHSKEYQYQDQVTPYSQQNGQEQLKSPDFQQFLHTFIS